MRKNKIVLVITLIITMILLKGCVDRKDVDGRNSPTIIAIDKEEDNYSINSILINFKDGKSNYKFSEAKEKTLTKAKEKNQYKIAGETSQALLRGIVFGEEFSQNSTYNFTEWLDKKDINGNLSICVYKGAGKELIKAMEEKNKKEGEPKDNKGNKEPSGADEGKINEVVELIGSQVKNGYKVRETFEGFQINNESEAKTSAVPILKNIDDKSIEVVGTAIFKGYKNIFNIDITDTQYLMLIRGIKTNGTIEFNEKNSNITGAVEVTNDRKVKVEEDNGKYIFNVDIILKGKVSELNESLEILKEKENIEKIQKEISREVTNNCEEFIEKSKGSIGYDIFDLAKYINIKYSKDANEIIGDKFFENAKININVDVKIEDT